ncbi:SAM-dependent methyltransferase [Pararhizobium haloflavum]|uniref:SAM-dependent methyltransferase n=1 Tax=Pararhizobium haloflavum TaxID=2037914 RepID=UPI000C17962B|nr:cyclopropane-fatty-acyl-phospholipid synthase family protein [Pararhizobium haloflavum]
MTRFDQAALDMLRIIVSVLAPRFAVTSWTGERIGPPDGPALHIASPDAVRRMALRPRMDTVVDLWAEGAVDVEGGTLFDIVDLKPEGRFKERLRALPKARLLALIPALLGGGSKRQTSELAGKDPFVSGSDKAAITHHYDVSNAFYRLFLDERMVYTCAYFKDFSNTIDEAQRDKLDHICRKLRLKPGDRLLDIGCGWGALLIHAAKHYGAIGTGVSLSEAQSELARERIRAEGLEGKITIEIKSYTEIEGTFDKIASIGMFEAVGIANYDTYFTTVHRLLAPEGIYLHHAITRRQKRSRRRFRKKSAEHLALVKYIFPGGELDHLGMTIENLEGHGFEVHDVENLREHYGRTCRLWAERLHARFADAVAEAGQPRARLWLLYLTGCALAFERGTVQINQTVATRRQRGPSGLPPTRDDLYRASEAR